MIAAARVAAYRTLRAVHGSGHHNLASALAQARTSLPNERDRALAGEIATGTLRWRGAFDHVIETFAKRPIARLDPEVTDILRMSMFQLMHLTRVPASAVVDDAVNLTKKEGKRSAAPLVNAILRRVSRERDRLPLPVRSATSRDTALDYLSITLSHPRWLVARWLDRYGFEAIEAWCQFNNGPPALTVRANRLRTTRVDLANVLREHDVVTREARFAPDGLIVESGNPLLTPLSKSGQFVVQDEASQLVCLMTGVQPGEVVLDACASPGGKTTAMAAAMGDEGLIVAVDVRPRRVRLLSETVARSGSVSIRVLQADAMALPLTTQFDCVLIDAPCSGLGTLRRDPDIRWRQLEEGLADNANFQQSLISALSPSVRPGGRLVYATCSSEPEENEEVVAGFLASHPEFGVSTPSVPGVVQSLIDEAGYLRTLPHRDGLEAFFAASLVRLR